MTLPGHPGERHESAHCSRSRNNGTITQCNYKWYSVQCGRNSFIKADVCRDDHEVPPQTITLTTGMRSATTYLMKLHDIMKVLPDVGLDTTNVRPTGELKRKDLVLLEQRLFEIQEGLEYKTGKGRRRERDIATLNDIRNVLLDQLEVNEARPGMQWKNVERMRSKILG